MAHVTYCIGKDIGCLTCVLVEVKRWYSWVFVDNSIVLVFSFEAWLVARGMDFITGPANEIRMGLRYAKSSACLYTSYIWQM